MGSLLVTTTEEDDMSGEIADPVGGQTISVAAYGIPVKDRTVMRYTDTAERDSLIPTPVRGDIAFIDHWVQVTGPLWKSAITVYGGNNLGSDAWNTVWTSDTMLYYNLDVVTDLDVGGELTVDDGIDITAYRSGTVEQVRNIHVQNTVPVDGDGLEGDGAFVLENTTNRGLWVKTAGAWLQIAKL